ncbi:MAG: thiamine pyrophosphate-dependent enzyme, partial [Actinobacteria bacterium]|nr:thiamine pyrophosphate-dependent enzyme [Actinomycetota bacterium]
MAPSPEPSGPNSGYVGQLLEQYLDNPEAVDPVWREFFEGADEDVLRTLPGLTRLVGRRSSDGGNGAPVPAPRTEDSKASAELPGAKAAPAAELARTVEPSEPRGEAAAADPELVAGVAAAMSLVKAYRMHGHLNARLDPLGSEPMGDPALDEARLQPPLTPELQARIPARLLRLSVPGDTLLEALPRLKEVYTGTIAYEIEHISDHAERVWLRQAIETGRFRRPFEPSVRRALLERLAQVEAFETYLRRAFIGQKQFSIEGLDALVPMLDEAIEIAAEGGAHEVLVGIAHRGRLNVLAHTVGRPYESILREFEGERTVDALVSDPEGGTGDVKYHLAASESRATRAGEVQVTLAANPSHLEAVDPVVEGLARAEQTDRSHGAGVHDPTIALAILIHGDASFAGQGV